MGRRRNIETAGMDEEPLKIVVAALGHTFGVRVQGRAFGARVHRVQKVQRVQRVQRVVVGASKFLEGASLYKTFTTALAGEEMHSPPLVGGATTFPPQFGGAAKGKRLNGQARRLTSPHLEVLCRTSTVAL